MPRRTLPPYQYRLRLRVPRDPPPPAPPAKPYLVRHQGVWKLFRNRWKSQFREPRNHAACISAPTIPALQQRLQRAHDGYRFGARI